MNYLSPTDGGCWFCSKSECDAFDLEFDTYLHLDCLKKELDIEKISGGEVTNPEAELMRYLVKDR